MDFAIGKCLLRREKMPSFPVRTLSSLFLYIVIPGFAHCHLRVCALSSPGLCIVIPGFVHCHSQVCVLSSPALCIVIPGSAHCHPWLDRGSLYAAFSSPTGDISTVKGKKTLIFGVRRPKSDKLNGFVALKGKSLAFFSFYKLVLCATSAEYTPSADYRPDGSSNSPEGLSSRTAVAPVTRGTLNYDTCRA